MDLIGEEYERIWDEIRSIIEYQFKNGIKNGIRGFLLYGEPGIGKTFLLLQICKRLEKLGWEYEFYDASHIAHKHYGESEKIISSIFERGKGRRRIIMFDDVDGLFITRDYGVKLETWYLSHLNVLFHKLDELDTSREIVFMTTNKIKLIDFALRDRLYNIQVPNPSKETLKKYVIERFKELKMDSRYSEDIFNKIDSGELKNFRKVDQEIIKAFVKHVKRQEVLNVSKI